MLQREFSLSDFIDAERKSALHTLFQEYEITAENCHFFRCDSRWKIEWRRRIYGIFLFPTYGHLRVYINKDKFVIKPGEFVMIAENTPHAVEISGKFKRTEHFTLHCQVQNRWTRSLVSRFSSPIGQLPHRTTWMHSLKELTSLTATDPTFVQRRGETMVRELLAWQLTHGKKLLPPPLEGDPRIQVVMERMNLEFASPHLSIDELADSVRIAPVYLRKLFRRETGFSPKQFLTMLRMRKAEKLLRHTSSSVKEVAVACGFTRDNYFHLVFQKNFGCRPCEYRTARTGSTTQKALGN